MNKLSDTSMELNKSQLLDLLQVTNANFPIGTFSHSFGVETYIRNGIAESVEGLEKVIVCYMYNVFMTTDLLAIREVYKLLDADDNNLEAVFELEKYLATQSLAKESRDGARRIGSQMVKIYLELYPECQHLLTYSKLIKEKKCYGNPAIAFSLLTHYLKIDLANALYAHTYTSITALIQNSVRAIPLGQIQGQKLMYKVKHDYFDDVYQKVLNLDFEKDFCKNNPGYEISQMEHEAIHVRLFMS